MTTPHPDAEPGTGTQYKTVASEGTYTYDGRTWHVGGEYWDAEARDLLTLAEIVKKSPWCATDFGPPRLVFEGRRGQMTISLERHSSAPLNRFTKRYEPDPDRP